MESVIESEKIQEPLRAEMGKLKELIHELENDKNVVNLSPEKKTSVNSLFKQIQDLQQQNSELSERLRETYSHQMNKITPSPHSAGLASIRRETPPNPE